MATFIDGIGASENIDTSGERVSIAGMDISSLAVDGVFNWEHKKDEPSQVVGKVLQAKKIFSEKDCESDRHLYFWNKIKTPYLYVMGELFDDYKDSAKEVAGMFRYDADRKGQNERNVMNFSVEGGKLEKVGMDVPKSVARKITVTVLPCNKAAIAELVPNPEVKQPKDDLESIFKTEPGIEIELFKPANPENFAEMIKKEALKKSGEDTASALGIKIGKTGSGKDVATHKRIADYKDFDSKDHRDAAEIHMKENRSSNNAEIKQHHYNKMQLHLQAAKSAERRESPARFANSKPTPKIPMSTRTNQYVDIPGKGRGAVKSEKMVKGASQMSSGPQYRGQGTGPSKGVHDEYETRGHSIHGAMRSSGMFTGKEANEEHKANSKKKLAELKTMPKLNLTKAMTAGSSMGAPSTLEGGAALSKEVILLGKRKKSQWLNRAKEEYKNWNKREQFEQYMSQRMPNLHKGEIIAIGQTIALQKALENEETLANMTGMAKAEKPHGGMNRVGQTRSGKHIYASQKADSKHYKDFTSDDHVDAAAAHHMSQMNGDQKMKQHHWKVKGTHLEASKTSMNPRDLKAHAETHGVHKPESHDRAEAGSAAAARLSMNSSSKTGFEKAEKGVHEQAKGVLQADYKTVKPAQQGTSVAGMHARGEYSKSGRSVSPTAEQSKNISKEIHKQKLGELKAMPKPNLTKSEELAKSQIFEGHQEFAGQKHAVKIHKQRKGRYTAFVTPGETHSGAPGSIHTLNYTHRPEKNGYTISHETPYGHHGDRNSETSKSIRAFVTDKVKEHNEKK